MRFQSFRGTRRPLGAQALLFLSLAACVCAGAPSLRAQAQAPTPDTKTELARQAEQRIKELQAESDRLAAQTRTTLTELRALELQREIKGEEVAKADAQLKELVAALDATTKRVEALESQRRADVPWVRERLVEIYKRGRLGYLRLLLSGTDIKALGRLSRGVAATATLDRVRLESHRHVAQQERTALAELQTRRQEVDNARAQALNARRALGDAVATHNRRLDELDARRDLAARFIGDLQGAQGELQRTLASLPDTRAALPIAPFKGMLDWPVRGGILSRFGRSAAGRFGTTIVRNGIEISTPEGAPVRAVHAGTVAFAAPFTGFGTLVILNHGSGAFTLYGHLSQAAVTNGARVGRGDVVGRAGRTPGGVPAAYFELRIDGRPVDPVQWLRGTR